MTQYNHLKIEKKWQAIWEKEGIYRAKGKSKKPKFYGLIEFPYPSGSGLHVGHIRSNTAMDIISRKRRMEGYNVLYPIGWDAFGLPTENYAIKTGIHPIKVTKQNTDTFRKQLKSLGFSFDWSREINTTDPKYYKWTQWIFLQFWKKGLAYKAKTEINWCPSCKIGLANEEVVGGLCERCGGPTEKREKEQWMLAITKYADRLDKDLDKVDYLEKIKIQQRNWIGKSEGAEIQFKLSSASKGTEEKRILIGTRNDAKFRMAKECFPSIPGLRYISLNDIPKVDDSELKEGQDYLENAKKKAEFYYKKTGIPTLSMDNVLWLEKWKKDNGVMLHVRKEANPKSEHVSDEEILKFLKSWVKKVGKSKARFIYAVAFAGPGGTESFVSMQRDYILQDKQSANFWPGYPIEALLVDAKTKVYKSEQDNKVRYGALIKDFKKVEKKWFNADTEPVIAVFTTRPDTLFGATYMVVAPEHALVQKLRSQIKNWNEVENYIKEVRKKTEIERTAEDKAKTGVELKGVKAINPATKEEIPVWIADYVLANYGTGAIMAVPAHDERDFEFAKKYSLPIKQVVMPDLLDAKNPPREDKKDTVRETVHVILRNPKNKTVLMLFLKGEKWKGNEPRSFIIGGMEEGESETETAAREIREETGFTDVSFAGRIPFDTQAKFFAAHKDVNRTIHVRTLVFDLVSQKQMDREFDEYFTKDSHDLKWVPYEEVERTITIPDDALAWEYHQKNGFAYPDKGILINSGQFDGMESEKAKKEIIKFAGGEEKITYKLRDWVFSRQRYWGEPIPLINCAKCGWVPVNDTDLPVLLPKVSKYKPTDNGESPLAAIKSWVNVKCPKCKGDARRETDTMPNWAGSSWYFLRYTDPKNSMEFASKDALGYFMKKGIDWYNGGMEHTTLHLLYSRFWHKFLYDLKLVPTSEPYMKRTSHGMILAAQGEKMSKSKGNVVNPDDLVKTFGADTIRMYEMFMGPFDQAVSWSTDAMIGPRRFLERVWRLGETISKAKNTKEIESEDPGNSLKKLLNKTIKKVSEDIESMRFNTAISSLMILLGGMEKEEQVSLEDYKKFLQILSPFAPHITEELWEKLGEKRSINISSWPKWDKKFLSEDMIKIAVQINGKVRDELGISSEAGEEEIRQEALRRENVIKHLGELPIKKIIYVKNRLINFVV